MREPRPSLAHRVGWLFPPVGVLVFALVIEGPRALDLRDTETMIGGLGMMIYFLGYAWTLGRTAIQRKHL